MKTKLKIVEPVLETQAHHGRKGSSAGAMRSCRRICIITPGYISSAPRVVKEADSLHDAGFLVHVIFSQGGLKWVEENDADLLSRKRWKWTAVRWAADIQSRGIHLLSYVRHNVCQRLSPWASRWGQLAACGESRAFPELLSAARAVPADLFIGHYPAGLAAAASAAKPRRAKIGYDVEDLHCEEQPDDGLGRKKTARIRLIEKRYLPRCSHITAASTLMAEQLTERYGIARPLAIHNVFSWSDRSGISGEWRDRCSDLPSFYWYSQTIGPGRGIEDMIRASTLVSRPIQIHLRGSISDANKVYFNRLAAKQGLSSRFFIHEPVAPAELLARAAEHDFGLALEQPVNMSRMLSVTNKFFLYLLAGLAVVATDVPGQRLILSECPGAGCLYAPGDIHDLARKVELALSAPAWLNQAKWAALCAARAKWNWESESAKLVHAISRIL